jgi:hypothetical protein
VPIQELFRYLWWKMLRCVWPRPAVTTLISASSHPASKSEKGLDTLSPDSSGVHTTRERIALGERQGWSAFPQLILSPR